MEKPGDKREGEQAAALNAAMLRWLNDLAPQGILTTDAALNIRGWNRWLEISSGRNASQMIGQNLLDTFPELVARKLDQYYRDALEGQVRVLSQRLHGYVLPMAPPGGFTSFAHMQQNARIAPMEEAGAIVGTITVIEDVTERVARDEERARLLVSEQKARKAAEVANRTKDEFLATISHELRTPLNAIMGWAQMLRGGNLDESSFARAAETIERNAKAQAQLINDLLDVSRIITGKLRLDVRAVDLAQVIGAAIDSARPAADAKGIRLQAVLDPLAGPVSGDPDRLLQVVWNLLSNAIKFTPKGGRVQIRLGRANSHVEIIVSDTGIGISPEFLPHIFERFSQADSTSTRLHAGLGLGLAIVRHLVELHGGTIQAASRGTGQGANFTVSLPITAARLELGESEQAAAPREDDEPFLPARLLQGLLVLVVDDEPDARELLITLLEQCGAQATAVASVAEALDAIGRLKPDVLISDIEMPGEDGYSLIGKLKALNREHGGQIPAIALTAYARAEDRKRALLAGFQMHLAKPVEPNELIAVIVSLAGRARDV